VEFSAMLDPASLQLAFLYVDVYLVIASVMQSFKFLSVDNILWLNIFIVENPDLLK
jgi:hypothetical protein